MSFTYWLPALMKSIGDRLASDATLVAMLPNGTDAITGSFPIPADDPQGTTYPLITFNPIASTNDDSFDGRREVHTIELHLFHTTRTQIALDSSTPLTTLLLMRERIIGDWNVQLSRTPSFGLDRWRPDFSGYTGIAATDYTAETIVFQSWADATGFDDSGVREFVLTFTVGLFKGAA